MREYDIEAMQEVLEEHNIEVPFEVAKEIAEDFIVCYQSNREHESPVPSLSKESDFMRAERLQRELDKIKRELKSANTKNEVFEKYILEKNNASYVGIDNGRIYIEKNYGTINI